MCAHTLTAGSSEQRSIAILLMRQRRVGLRREMVRSSVCSGIQVSHPSNALVHTLYCLNAAVVCSSDHHPSGAPLKNRRAIQLGLKNVLSFANGEDILRIDDLTDFVARCTPTDTSSLVTPKYRLSDWIVEHDY